MSKVPRYWDTNKGKVLRSIFLSSERTWLELQKYSGLDEDSLNDTLRQLFQEGIISKSGSSYWIEDYELYCEYRDYEIATKTEASTEQQEIKTQLEALKQKLKPIMEYSKQKKLGKNIISVMLGWCIGQDINFDPWSEHFFVKGDKLDQISKNMLDKSKSHVVVINPFVDQCSLSDKLKTIGSSEKQILLVTRSPESEWNSKTRKARHAYHNALLRGGIQMYYNDRIHSKIIIFDEICGIVSSMNFKSESSSGKNLESGLVSWQTNTMDSLRRYAKEIINDPETRLVIP